MGKVYGPFPETAKAVPPVALSTTPMPADRPETLPPIVYESTEHVTTTLTLVLGTVPAPFVATQFSPTG